MPLRVLLLVLYQEILLLKTHFKGKYTTENVKPYYKPLINPSFEIGRHLFWSNFQVNKIKLKKYDAISISKDSRKGKVSDFNEFDISNYKIKSRKDQILRNCVQPEIGLHIFNRARNIQIEENTPHGKLIFPD